MKILAHLHLYQPHHNAGGETTAHSFLRAMVKRGHEVRVIVPELTEDYEYEGVRVMIPPPYPDTWNREQYRWADIAITHLNCTRDAMRCARDTAKPLVHLIHNHNQLKANNVKPLRAQLVVFNSRWIENLIPWPYPKITIHPVVEPNLYRTSPGDHVTMINLTPTKGVEVFFELARRFPTQKFLGVEGAYYEQFTRGPENITFLKNTPDILSVFAKTKVLLMPSDYESYGRCAVEAACSGIPSIVHPTEGLKEALGDAGIFCDRRNVDDWENALDLLLNDQRYYAERSKKSLALADSLEPEKEFDRFEQALLETVERGIVHKGAVTVEMVGEDEYRRLAIAGGYFDPRRERNYRPALSVEGKGMKFFISDRKLWRTRDGEIVEDSDPRKSGASLFITKGGTLPIAEARRLGLVDEPKAEQQEPEAAEQEEKAIDGPVENKAILSPAENKSIEPKRRGRKKAA